MSMDSLCATCDICRFMPKQSENRVLVTHKGEKPKILVIDDQTPSPTGLDMANVILGDQPFDYTQTIRCWYDSGELYQAQIDEALLRCSVWTKNLVGNYAIYLCTENALRQLSIGEERKSGDAFVNARLGLVLCIEPLGSIDGALVSEYQSKVRRLFKKAGIK